jgi:hypothetical protein|nr:MAG TPA: hypothetical protein [Caudoviricetes sp.]DAT75271.1 MAG TPA: hypothetical protein [Caudoviricetes sp.]
MARRNNREPYKLAELIIKAALALAALITAVAELIKALS